MFLKELSAPVQLPERCLEDHEVVPDVQARWHPEGDTKLVFRKNYAKYEFFRKPMVRKPLILNFWSWYWQFTMSGCVPFFSGFATNKETKCPSTPYITHALLSVYFKQSLMLGNLLTFWTEIMSEEKKLSVAACGCIPWILTVVWEWHFLE